jgi:hypothetical protein
VPVYVFVSGAVVTPIVLKVKEDIVVRSRVVASVAVIITLRLVVGVSVAIIVVITIRRLLRVCVLVSLFSLTKRVFTSFAL